MPRPVRLANFLAIYVLQFVVEAIHAMSRDVEIQVNKRSNSSVNMEDFGRFNPEAPDFHEEISDDESEEAYGEENAGA